MIKNCTSSFVRPRIQLVFHPGYFSNKNSNRQNINDILEYRKRDRPENTYGVGWNLIDPLSKQMFQSKYKGKLVFFFIYNKDSFVNKPYVDSEITHIQKNLSEKRIHDVVEFHTLVEDVSEIPALEDSQDVINRKEDVISGRFKVALTKILNDYKRL
jgi:hypothetical protein